MKILKTSFVREPDPEEYHEKVSRPSIVGKFLINLIGSLDVENVVAIHVDRQNNIICVDYVHIGTDSESFFHPKTILRRALLTGARGIIMAHNHPGGSLIPSDNDIEATNRLVNACKIIGVEFLDALIVTDTGFYSFAEHNLLDSY